MDDVRVHLDRLNTSLDQNSALLIRVDERLKAFIDKVESIETDMEEVKKHVQAVRTVSKVAGLILTGSGGITLVWELFLRHP